MRTIAAGAAACWLAGLTILAGQQLPDASLRAAYLFNFARFTEWPHETLPDKGPLRICTDDESVFTALRDAVVDKSVNGHPVVAAHLDAASLARTCQVAYLRRVSGNEGKRLYPDLADAHVFTVADTQAGMGAGAVAHFFVEDRRLRFAIHLPHASRAGLQLSSRLLSLAVIHRTPDADTPY